MLAVQFPETLEEIYCRTRHLPTATNVTHAVNRMQMPITSNFAHWRSKLAKLPCTCKISVTSSFLQRNARAQATNSRPIQCNLLKNFLSTLAERPVPPRTCCISLEKVNKLSVHGHRQQQSKRTNRTTEERESSYCKLQHQQILQPKFNMYHVHREPAKWQSKPTMSIAYPRKW